MDGSARRWKRGTIGFWRRDHTSNTKSAAARIVYIGSSTIFSDRATHPAARLRVLTFSRRYKKALRLRFR
jgi:hypothetical protein